MDGALFYVLIVFVLVGGAFISVVLPHLASVRIDSKVALDPKSVDGQIQRLTQSIAANPQKVVSYVSLSQAYLQKVRETADASYYQKINDLMDQAEKIDAKNANIPAMRASVMLGRHKFKEAYAFAMTAVELAPDSNVNYGLLGDAQVELGQYKEAAASFQKMVNIRPDYSSYIRIAYIRELYGDTKGAKQALQSAIEFGSSFKESIAFAYVELGKLQMRDDIPTALREFQYALEIVPDYPPALEGLGKIAFFGGDNKKAETYFKKAFTKLAIVQYSTDLGDIYMREGDNVKAKQYYALSELAFMTSVQSGVDTDLEESLFLSDHDADLPKALAQARRAYVDRPSVYAADYLSWALYKNGEAEEAAKYTKEALRLGEVDPLILFHQGLIATKNNDTAAGQKYFSLSLKINPYFSILQSKIARSSLH